VAGEVPVCRLTQKQYAILELLRERKLHGCKQIQAMIPWDYDKSREREPSYSGICVRVKSLEKKGYLFCKGMFRGWNVTEKGIVAMAQYRLKDL
jgi:DNA-binding PadR family transcriptional regulator